MIKCWSPKIDNPWDRESYIHNDSRVNLYLQPFPHHKWEMNEIIKHRWNTIVRREDCVVLSNSPHDNPCSRGYITRIILFDPKEGIWAAERIKDTIDLDSARAINIPSVTNEDEESISEARMEGRPSEIHPILAYATRNYVLHR